MSKYNGNARSNVFIGTDANDGTGDSLRDAFEKTNNNIFDLYTFLGNGTHLGNVTRIEILGGNVSNLTVDLAVSDGGTGAGNATNARVNLGLIIGTNVQAYDVVLDSLANIAGANNKLAYFNSGTSLTVTHFTQYAREIIAANTASDARTTLGLGNVALLNDGLFVVNSAQVNSNVIILGNLNVEGNVVVGKSANVAGNLTIGNVTIIGDVNFSTSRIGSGWNFSKAISNVRHANVTDVTSNIFVAPSTPSDSRYILQSLYVVNVDPNYSKYGNVIATLGGEKYGDIAIAHQVPIPFNGGGTELLIKPKVLYPGDYVTVKSDANSRLYAALSYETVNKDNTYFGGGIDISLTNTYYTFYVANSNVMIESILISNDSAAANTRAFVEQTDSSGTIVGYYAFGLVVPDDATIELIEKPKFLANTHRLRAKATQTSVIEIVYSGREL